MDYTITCLICARAIPFGEPYYALTAAVETDHGGTVEPHHVDLIGVRCVTCGPFDVQALVDAASRPAQA
jgi:hypothetical protein